jgi:hypothetical protein
MASLIDLDTEGENTPVIATTVTSHAMSAGNSAASSIRSIRSGSSNSRPLSPREKAEAKVAVLQQLDKLGDFIASMSPTQETTPSIIDTLIAIGGPVETTIDVVTNTSSENSEPILDQTLEKTTVTELSVSSLALNEVSIRDSTIPEPLIDNEDTSRIVISSATVTTITATTEIEDNSSSDKPIEAEALKTEALLSNTAIESMDDFANFTEVNNDNGNGNDADDDFGDFTASNTACSHNANLSERVMNNNKEDDDFGDFGDFEDQGSFPTLNETTNELASTKLDAKPIQDIVSTIMQ